MEQQTTTVEEVSTPVRPKVGTPEYKKLMADMAREKYWNGGVREQKKNYYRNGRGDQVKAWYKQNRVEILARLQAERDTMKPKRAPAV